MSWSGYIIYHVCKDGLGCVSLRVAGQVYDFDVPCTDSAIALSRSALARISQHASCKILGRNLFTIQWLGGSDLELWVFIFPIKNGELRSYQEFPNWKQAIKGSHGFSALLKNVPWSNFGFSLPMLGIVINPLWILCICSYPVIPNLYKSLHIIVINPWICRDLYTHYIWSPIVGWTIPTMFWPWPWPSIGPLEISPGRVHTPAPTRSPWPTVHFTRPSRWSMCRDFVVKQMAWQMRRRVFSWEKCRICDEKWWEGLRRGKSNEHDVEDWWHIPYMLDHAGYIATHLQKAEWWYWMNENTTLKARTPKPTNTFQSDLNWVHPAHRGRGDIAAGRCADSPLDCHRRGQQICLLTLQNLGHLPSG